MKLRVADIPKPWARLYFWVLETIVIGPLIIGVVLSIAMPDTPSDDVSIFFVAVYIASYFLLLLTCPILIRIVPRLGWTAFVTVVVLFVTSVLTPIS